MLFRQLLNDESACASYLLGCTSKRRLAVVDPHADLVDDYIRTAEAHGVPIVAVVIGEGSSGGALALGVADRVIMLENSTYSVISPEGGAAILWRDAAKAREAAAAFQPTAANCYRWGIADAVVPEPPGGAHRDHDEAARLLGGYLTRALRDLRAQSSGERRRLRRDRYRRLGAYREFPAGDPAAIASGRLDATTNGAPTGPG